MLARAMLCLSSSTHASAAAARRMPACRGVSASSFDGTFSYRPTAARARRGLAHASASASARSADDSPLSPPPRHVSLIQGASRGIGLEMVRQLLEVPDANLPGRPAAAGGHVVATCRDPANASGLTDLLSKHPGRLTVVRLDVESTATIVDAAETVKRKLGRVDLLCQTAAVLHVDAPEFKMRPETSIARLDENAALKAYRVNALGPTLVTKHFAGLLTEGTRLSRVCASEGDATTNETNDDGEKTAPAAVVANLSARVSSVGDNALGGWHSYRASKTALNQLTKNCAIEFSRKKHPITFLLLHPGTVDTDLSEPFKKNVPAEKLFTAERAARQLLRIVGAKTQLDTGKFFAWDGTEVPW